MLAEALPPTLVTGVAALVACSFGAVFLVASAQKLVAGKAYDELLVSHGLFPVQVVPALRVALPAAELALGLWLWSLYALSEALFTLCAVLVVFLGYRVMALRRGVPRGCGCLGVDDHRHGPHVQVGASVLYLVVAAVGALDDYAAAPPILVVHLLAAATGTLLAALLVRGALRIRRRALS